MKTTKEEKYLAVAKKIKEADNKLTTEYYYKTKLERSTTEMLDLYNPIFFKYNRHLMEEGKPISLALMTDEDMSVFALAYRIYNGKDDKYKVLKPEEVSEDMLDESGELIILRVIEENGETILEPIEDEEEFNEIGEIFEERLADLFDFEEE